MNPRIVRAQEQIQMYEAGDAVGGPLGSRWNAAGKLLGNEAPEMLLDKLLAVCGGTKLSHKLLER